MEDKLGIQVVREIYSYFAAGNIPAVLERLHPDVKWRVVGPEKYPFFGNYVGHEGFQHFLSRLTETSDITRFEPLRFIDAGSTVVVTGSETACVRRNGEGYTVEWCHIFQIEGCKVISFEEYLDSAPMVAAFDIETLHAENG